MPAANRGTSVYNLAFNASTLPTTTHIYHILHHNPKNVIIFHKVSSYLFGQDI